MPPRLLLLYRQRIPRYRPGSGQGWGDSLYQIRTWLNFLRTFKYAWQPVPVYHSIHLPFKRGSDKGQSADNRGIGQARRAQDHIDGVTHFAVLNHEGTVCADQHIVLWQQVCVRIFGHRQGSYEQEIASIRYSVDMIETRFREQRTTYGTPLGNRFREKAGEDQSLKRANATYVTANTFCIEKRRNSASLCKRWQRTIARKVSEMARRQTDLLCKARGERAERSIANLEADIGHAQWRGQEEPLHHIQAQRREKLARGYADDLVKHATEIIRTQASDIGHILQRKRLAHALTHRPNHAFNHRQMRIPGREIPIFKRKTPVTCLYHTACRLLAYGVTHIRNK